jgi:hypothetical protein
MALTSWRENREGGASGMQSVVNVLQNRAKRRKTSPYAEAVRRLQFSSLTAPGDPQLVLWPADEGDLTWVAALNIAEQAAAGTLPDLVLGATMYYAPRALAKADQSTQPFVVPGTGQSVVFPRTWNRDRLQYVKTVSNQLFFLEI